MRYNDTDVLTIADELSSAYADIFSQPPWNKGHGDDRDPIMRGFRDRLENDVKRPGFRAIVADAAADIDGFSSGWTTQSPYPSNRAYYKVTDSIGAERVERLLVGAIEVDELAVRPTARGQGLGRRLLSELIADAPDGRAWLLTWTEAPAAVEFYRRAGWHRVPPTPGAENDIVTYLSPDHPGAHDLG
ncbi:MAG: GNAT family N-acetyltransferase [Stackebrandtia sp.]